MGIKTSGRLSLYRIFFGLLFFALMQPLQAAPLNLTPSFPDFVVSMSGASNIYSYDSVSNTLTIAGSIASYTETQAGTQFNILYNTSFSLSATFGNLINCPGPACTADVTSGSFSLFGEIYDALPFLGGNLIYDGFVGGQAAGGDPNGLWQGNLVDFGWASSSNTTGLLEFTFNNTSGILATGTLTEGGNPGGYSGGGMILHVNTSDLANIANNFENNLLTTSWTGTGVGDVFVPVPAAIWLFGSGLAGLAGFASRRRSSV